MDDGDKNKFIKIIKQRMIDILESGVIKEAVDQYKFIEDNLLRIACFDDKKVNKAILKYFEDQSPIENKIKDTGDLIKNKQEELQKPMDEYGNNVKDIYEFIKKL